MTYNPFSDYGKLLEMDNRRRLSLIALWRREGRCTECGNVLLGGDVLDAQGVVFFGGAPHEAGDRVCFWCIEGFCQEPWDPPRWPGGRA
jgi:hypothetical protein